MSNNAAVTLIDYSGNSHSIFTQLQSPRRSYPDGTHCTKSLLFLFSYKQYTFQQQHMNLCPTRAWPSGFSSCLYWITKTRWDQSYNIQSPPLLVTTTQFTTGHTHMAIPRQRKYDSKFLYISKKVISDKGGMNKQTNDEE